jgi:predicted Fe-Mo cluster-binding NifX family protein
MEFEAVPNTAANAASGAGPMAAQAVANHHAEVVIAGRVGPKAERALAVAGIRFVAASGTVREVVESQRQSEQQT